MLKDLPPVTEEKIRGAVELGFHVRPYSFTEDDEIEARETWLREMRNAGPRDHKFGAALQGAKSYYVLSLDEKKAATLSAGEEGSAILRLLDVSLLKSIIFKQLLGLTEDQIKPQITVHYTHIVNAALNRVHSGEMQSAWFLNHTSLEEIMSVADNGEKMPQKSTYFYPKPLSGLVFYNMNNAGI
jgi:uncharacterized protein (DUF1015 family)